MTLRKITISLIFCAGAAIASNAGLAAGGRSRNDISVISQAIVGVWRDAGRLLEQERA